MNVGSLFSGIGGLDLGLERAGMTIRWQAEIDPFCTRVLAKHWPDIPNHGDVTTNDWSAVERVDLICGGYPCQPFSLAGSRQGEADPRHLWPHMRDAIRALRPHWVLLENVDGHRSLGFADVLADLADLGFDAEWSVVPAAAVGSPHVRRRLFCVAYTAGERRWPGLREEDALEDWACASSRGWWESEPGVGRVARRTPRGVDRRKALGNAVVPQVAEWIGRRIIEAAAA